MLGVADSEAHHLRGRVVEAVLGVGLGVLELLLAGHGRERLGEPRDRRIGGGIER